MLRLLTLGGLALVRDDGSAAPRVKPPRLAMLAALAAAGERGVSRERLMALFWPDADEGHARHSLRQALYALRQELGDDLLVAHGATLRLDRRIATDLAEFRDALAAEERARAVAVARGPFLDDFYLPGAPEFDRWVEEERARLTAEVTGVLTALASEAVAARELDGAVEWSRQLTVIDPLSGRFAAAYLRALAARGDRAQALAFAREHEALVRRELSAAPDPDVSRLHAELRAAAAKGALPGTEDPRATASRGVAVDVPAGTDGPRTETAPNVMRVRWPLARHGALVVGAVALLAFVVTAGVAWQRQRSSNIDRAPTFAVGFIRDDAVPDSLRIGGVLTDMLATNLTRVDGLSVLANSRLLELIRPGQDSSPAGYIDAARRAGATELLEGRILATADPALTLEMRRVELRSGIVRHAYRVSAADRYALVDSMTRAIAHHLRLISSAGSVADVTTASPVAYRLYEEGLRAYHQFDTKTAQRLMHAALAEDSTFAMAAYYVAALAMVDQKTLDGRHVAEAQRSALQLAERAPDRDRLMITADLLEQAQEPRALAVVETLTTRYPNDPRALMTLGRMQLTLGDLPGAARATERAIAIDSAAEAIEQANCRLCRDYLQLADVYLLWDSLPAAQRTARRFLAARPSSSQPHLVLAVAAARLGDSASAYASFRRLLALGGTDRSHKLAFDLTLEEYDVLERDVRQLLASSSLQDWSYGAWFYVIALRNQGRLREAARFHRTGSLPGLPPPAVSPVAPDDFNEGILALERGDPRRSAAVFGRRVRFDMSPWSPGFQSRHRAWNGTLQGMALAAAGDTGAVRVLADSVETWGRGSLYGRDRKAHHYLRGLVLAAEGRHEDAVAAYRAAIHSPTLGFTRVNYELGRSLMHLGRPVDAVAAVQPALRGEIDAANLYITRTELHELLAQAFDAAGMRDSAAVHYRAVSKAWARADPAFHARRAAAERWLRK